ncbi:MAG: hypothetical protein Q8R79_03720, partial [Legionellaceae bacterium]|nr:hypothetical protein [Legionellaceae bacterium]
MGYKDGYYYSSFISEASYSKTPSHIIDPVRLRQNKPCFKTPMESSIQKKKTLVVNLTSDFFANANEADIVQYRLWSLWKEGFTIYEYSEGQLKKMDEIDGFFPRPEVYKKYKKAVDLELPFDNLFLSNDALAQKAIQTYGLNADEVLVLGAQKIRTLMAGDASDWLFLDPFENIDLENSMLSSASLAQLLLLHAAKIQRLNLMGCLNISEEFPGDIKLSLLRKLSLGGSLYGVNRTLSISPLLKDSEYLEDLRLRKLDIPEDIFTFLKNPQYLKSLTLHHCKWGVNASENYDFSGLERFDAAYLDAKNFRSIIQHASQLKGLKVDAGFQVSDALNGLQCPNLEELIVKGLRDMSTLAEMLISTKKLKKLSMEGLLEGISTDSFKEVNVPLLEDFELSTRNEICDAAYFQKIFDTATHLKKISAQVMHNLPAVLKDHHYPFLEELALPKSDLTIELLQSLLSSAKQLKKLDISECNGLHEGVLSAISLPFLEELKMRFLKVDAASLMNLLNWEGG